jgi:hypothetical protein
MMTTPTVREPASRHRERGAALVFALLGLATLTILGLGFTSIGMLGATMTRNEKDTQEALALADAGLAHARKMITYQEWDWLNLSPFLTSGNGTACDGDELAQAPTPPAGQAPLAAGYPATFIAPGGNTLGTGRYQVVVCDDDETDLDETVSPAVLNANPIFDANRRIIVRSTGTTNSGATVTLEQVLGANAMPAVLVNGNVLAGGNVEIGGANGSIHANGNMDINGTSVCAHQEFQATGTVTGNPDGGVNCNQPGEKRPGSAPVNVRVLSPGAYKAYAEYWIRVNFAGNQPGGGLPVQVYRNTAYPAYNLAAATCVPGAAGCPWVAAPAAAWVPAGTTNKLAITVADNFPKSVYYTDANVIVAAAVNSQCNGTEMTILTEGWLSTNGGAKICGRLSVPGVNRITIIAGTDIKLDGNAGGSGPEDYQGLYYARHQVGTQGTPRVYGQVVALNLADTAWPVAAIPGAVANPDNLVPLDNQGRMTFNGNGEFRYDGGGMTATGPLSWRECRPDAASVDPDPCGDHWGGPN